MNTKGFTLIELLIVMAIVGILAATVIPNLLSAREHANNTATIGFVRNTINAIESERDLFGYIPATLSTTCNVVVGVSLPSAVQDCTITYILSAGERMDYTIAATSSSTKNITWDGVAFSMF